MEHTIIDLPKKKKLFERYRRIQNVCDRFLEQLEDNFDQNLIFDDPKSLQKLDVLLKLRTRLLDLDREIQIEHDKISQISNTQKIEDREKLIDNLIKKIRNAVDK